MSTLAVLSGCMQSYSMDTESVGKQITEFKLSNVKSNQNLSLCRIYEFSGDEKKIKCFGYTAKTSLSVWSKDLITRNQDEEDLIEALRTKFGPRKNCSDEKITYSYKENGKDVSKVIKKSNKKNIKKFELEKYKYDVVKGIIFFDKMDKKVCAHLLGNSYKHEYFKMFLNSALKPIVSTIKENHLGGWSYSDANRWELVSQAGKPLEFFLGERYKTIEGLKKGNESNYDFTGCEHIKPKETETGCTIQ